MNLPNWLARLAHGILAGVLLAAARAPLGLDWTQTAVLQGSSTALFRAAGLFLVALGLDARRSALRAGLGAGWLAGVLAGFTLQAFAFDRVPQSRAGFALLFVLGVLALRALAGKRGDAEPGESPARGARVAFVLLGAGIALALEPLAREVSLFTAGNGADGALVATVLLAATLVGALAFGPLWARLGPAGLGFAVPAALSAGASVFGLLFVAHLTPIGLHDYLLRMDGLVDSLRALDRALALDLHLAELPPLDGAAIGTWWITALLAAAAFVLPAFALGGALAAGRDTARVAQLAFGAGLGVLAAPHLVGALGTPLRGGALPSVSWTLVALGAGGAGAALVLLGTGSPRRLPWFALAALSAALPWIRPRLAFASVSPWSARVIEPELLWPTAEGLLCVEPGRGGISHVTLDRRRLTPELGEEAGDALALASSFELLEPAKRAGTVRTLFIGQLTPARAEVLAQLGSLELERTAPWHAAMPVLEQYLFAGAGEAPGRILAPAAARARLAEGAYDWVVACGIRGPIVTWKSEAAELWSEVDAPRVTDLALPDGTVGVAWIPAASRVGRGVELAPLLASFDGLQYPTFGLVRGLESCDRVPLFRLDSWTGPAPLENLASLPQLRSFALERAWAQGLASATHPALARGLAQHFAAQTLSSPYETRAQQIELEEEALRSFFEAVPAPGRLDPLSRALWESVAWLCFEKRQPEFALVYLEPVAERFAPWPALERGLARAYREVLEPEIALAFAERALAAAPREFELLIEAARAAKEAGTPERATPFLERALALQPSRLEEMRSLGLLLLEVGDPRGRALLEPVLREHPEDEELLRVLSAGVSPPE